MFGKKLIWFGLFASLPIVLSALVMENSYSQTEASIPQSDTLAAAKSETQARQAGARDELTRHRLSAIPQQAEPGVAVSGGSLKANDKLSAQELQERAQYWESRGRSDLAAKLRNQVNQSGQKNADAAGSGGDRRTAASGDSASTGAAAPAYAATGKTAAAGGATVSAMPQQAEADAAPASGGSTPAGDKLSAQELQKRAQYWESHGRSDLAAKLRNQVKPATPSDSGVVGTAAEQPKVRLVLDRRSQTGTAMPETAVAAVAPPSRQELDGRAQYWEARGRTDLADQVRQKLQSLEPRDGAGLSRRTGGEGLQGQQARADNYPDSNRSALEDSLLKNPNSLKTRLDLAQIYRNTGELAKARMQVDSVLLTNPDLPDVLYASAQLYAEQRLWWETLQTLEKVAPVSRTADMANLQKMAWAHVQLDRADALVRQGRQVEAEVLLRKVALELSINSAQARLAEPPPLWNTTVTAKKHGKKKHRRKES